MTVHGNKYAELLWYALLLAGMVLGAFAFAYILINGHAHEFNAPWEISWGILLSTYELFILVSAGLCLVAGLGRLLGMAGNDWVMARAVQVAGLALFMGLATVSIELTHPMRLTFEAVESSDYYQAIVASVSLYVLFLFWLVVEYLALRRGFRAWPMIFSLLGWGTVLAAIHRMDVGLGLVGTVEFGEGVLFFVHSTFSALVLGTAILSQIIHFGYWVRGVEMPLAARRPLEEIGRLQAIFLTLLLLYVPGSTVLGFLSGSQEVSRAAGILLSGPLALNFWLLELAVGVLVPAVILFNRASCTPVRVGAAGLLAMFGQFFLHYDRMIATQLAAIPAFPGRFDHSLGSFIPCPPKSFAVVGAFSLFLFLWTLTEKLRPQDSN